jgi:hypothetical protein
MSQLSHPYMTQEYLRQQGHETSLRAERYRATCDCHDPTRARTPGAKRLPAPLRQLAAAVIRLVWLPRTPPVESRLPHS